MSPWPLQKVNSGGPTAAGTALDGLRLVEVRQTRIDGFRPALEHTDESARSGRGLSFVASFHWGAPPGTSYCGRCYYHWGFRASSPTRRPLGRLAGFVAAG